MLGLVTQLKGKKGDEYVNKWDDLHWTREHELVEALAD